MRARLCPCGTRADIRQLTTGFPKKLLVAISVVVIIAMCLRPAEAASLERRHRLHDNMPKATKDTGASRSERSAPLKEHKRRHHGQLKSGMQTTKEQGNRPIVLYEKVRIKIANKMAYTRDNFNVRRKALKAEEQGDYGLGMPGWLPKTNFVDIHFHKYGASSKNGEATKSKKIFEFLSRKLYKSLLDYLELFTRFIDVKVTSPDNAINRYNEKRREVFNKTAGDIYSALEDIKDAMNNVNITKWQKITSNKSKLRGIELEVDGAKYLKNDDILLRAYGNLLDNWHLEFNCSKFRTKHRKVNGAKCMQYDNSLKEKRARRNRNRRRLRTRGPAAAR